MRCTRFKRVRSRHGGTVRRCANFSGGKRRRARAAGGRRRRRGGGYRRGHRPFNKGKRCKRLGVNRRGIVTCRSYGGRRRARRGYRRLVTSPSAAARTTAWGNRLRARLRVGRPTSAGGVTISFIDPIDRMMRT